MNTLFREYPKRLAHPDYAPAEWKTIGEGNGIFAPEVVMTKPERFPEVVVTTLDQEKQYASRGYRPKNMANAAEYEQAILDQQDIDGYVNQEYPKWRYHAFEIPVVVYNEEENLALGEGWHDAPVPATEDDLPIIMRPEELPENNLAAEAASLAEERAAFERERAEFEKHKLEAFKTKQAEEDAKKEAGQQTPYEEGLVVGGNVERHGLQKIDKRSKEYRNQAKE